MAKDNESEGRRPGCLTALLVPLVGLVVMWVGYGMWRSPELNWKGFWAAGAAGARWLVDEAVRLWHDPFAILGIAVMVGGFVVIIYGIRRLFRGS